MTRWLVTTAFLCISCVMLAAISPAALSAQGDIAAAARHHERGAHAAAAGDTETYFAEALAASRLVPPHPVLLYQLARAAARTGRQDLALGTLQRLTPLGTPRDPAADSGFIALWPLAEFQEQAAAMRRAIEPRLASDTAFVIDRANLVVENVAWDSSARVYYAGSMARSTILRVDSTGRSAVLVPADELNGGQPLGMRVDAAKRTLWAAVIWPADSAIGRPVQTSELLKIELPTGRIRARYTPGQSGVPHSLNDLVIAPDGDLYATASDARAVWRLPHRGEELELWLQFDSLVVFPNGIAMAPDGQTLFVAHQTGILAIERVTRRTQPLGAPEGTTIMGIDGLYATGNRLVGVQNSMPVHQVISMVLDYGSGSAPRITCAEVLERRHPAYLIPTTGTLAGGALLYVANSELRRLNARGVLIDPENEHRTVILRLRLPQSGSCDRAAAHSRADSSGTTIVYFVRHGEVEFTHPNFPLNEAGKRRAAAFARTVGAVAFTHLYSSHTTRAKQMLDAIAARQSLTIRQLPEPGTRIDGKVVSDTTPSRLAVPLLVDAIRALPPGSTALVGVNSDNIYGVLHGLGVPAATPERPCKTGSTCVPCLTNRCFPPEYDHLWILILPPAPDPPRLVELRYGTGNPN